MSEDKIRRIAMSRVRDYEKISNEAYVESIKQKYIKHMEDRTRPGKSTTKKAWVVRFIDDKKYPGAWIDVVLNDDGEVLRIDKSR